ncbi:conjugative pilus assembly domain protein [Orientia tsutsugamushi str. UT76]|nr:conjugative pilus assembly domain protein [Orientia tsutsugamushi str. UT76]
MFMILISSLSTVDAAPTGFYGTNDKHGYELDESAANSKLIQQLMIIESRN